MAKMLFYATLFVVAKWLVWKELSLKPHELLTMAQWWGASDSEIVRILCVKLRVFTFLTRVTIARNIFPYSTSNVTIHLTHITGCSW